MNFLKEKWFWIIFLGAIAITVAIYFATKKPKTLIGTSSSPAVSASGSGCPSSSGLDKFGKPCPPIGANCPNISGLDVYGNVCPPDCFNGCKSSKPGYDCNGNFSANC